MKVSWIAKLLIYFTIISISGPFFDNWTSTEKFLFLTDAYSEKCKPSEVVGPPTDTFRCEKQQLEVSGLLSYARMPEFLSSVLIGICVDRFGPRIVSVVGILFCILSWVFMTLYPKSGILLKPSMIIIGISTNATLFPALTIERYTKRYKAQVLIFIGSSSSLTCILMKLIELVAVKSKLEPITVVTCFIVFFLTPCLICSYIFFPNNVKKDVNRIGQKDAYIYPTAYELMGYSKGLDSNIVKGHPPDANILVSDNIKEDHRENGHSNTQNEVAAPAEKNEGHNENADIVELDTINVDYDTSKDSKSRKEGKLGVSSNVGDISRDMKDDEIQNVATKRNSFEDSEQMELTHSDHNASNIMGTINTTGTKNSKGRNPENVSKLDSKINFRDVVTARDGTNIRSTLSEPDMFVSNCISGISVNRYASSRLDIHHRSSRLDKIPLSNRDANKGSSRWDRIVNNSLERMVVNKRWTWRGYIRSLRSFEVILCIFYYSLNVVSITYSQQSYNIIYSGDRFLLEFIEYVLPLSFVPCVLFMVFTRFFSPFYLVLTVGAMWLCLNVCSMFESFTAGILMAILLTISYSIYNTHVYIYLESKIDKDYSGSVLGLLNTVAGLSMLINIFLISPIADREVILNINISLLVVRLVFLGLFVYRHINGLVIKRKPDKRVTSA